MPGVSVGPSLDSARGGLQYVPLSDSVLPTVSKKRGGITDVAGYDGDEASLTELDTPVETFKSPEAKEAMLAKSISDAASASARPEQSFITPPPQPAMQAPAPASMGPGPGPSNAPMPAPAPSPAPNAPAPMLASNKPQALQQGIQGLSAAVAAPTNYASLMTQEQQAAMRQQLAEEHAKAAGQEPYTDAQKALAARIAAHPAEDQRMQGLAALMAIPGILSGNQAGRGLAQGASDYAKNMMALKADQEKRDQAEIAMNLHLTESQRADKLGHWVYGMQGTKDYVKEGHEVDALNEKILKDKAEMAKWEAVAGKADKVTQPRGLTASEERLQEIDALSAQIKDEHPDWNPAKIRAEAVKQRGTFGPSLVTSQTTATTAANKLTTEETDKRRKEAQDLWVVGLDPKTKKYYKDTFGGNAPNQYYDDYVNGKVQSPTGAPATKPAAAPVVMDKHVPASLPPLTVMYQGKQFTFPDKASYDAYMAKLNGR
jgi:hypothetical protein